MTELKDSIQKYDGVIRDVWWNGVDVDNFSDEVERSGLRREARPGRLATCSCIYKFVNLPDDDLIETTLSRT